MAGLLDDWLYTKDENQETAPERLQPLWGGLIKAGLLSVAGGGNLMPEQRAQYIAKAGEALGEIPNQMLARKSDIAKQKLQTLQGEHMKSQIASEKQKRDQQAKMDALTSDPEFMKKLQAGDQSARIALGQIAMQAGHYDTAMKALMPEKIISLGGGDFYNSETKQVYDHYTGEYRSPKPGEVPGATAPPATQGSPPAQPPAVVPPVETPPAVTAPAVTPPVVTPPSAPPPVVPAPPPVMPPVGGPPLPPYQQPFTVLHNAPGLPQFQGGGAQDPGGAPPPGSLALPQKTLPRFDVPGLGMSNPPPPPPPSLAPPPVPPPVMPPPSAPAPGPVQVPPTAGGPAPPPVVPAAVPPTAAAPVITPQPVVTPAQGSNDQAMIERARNAPVDAGAARELGGQPPGRPKIFVNGKAIDVPMPRNPNINAQALARVPEKARPIVMGLIDGNIGFGDLRGMKDKERYLKDAMSVDSTLSNTTNAQRNVWMKQLGLSSPGTPGGLISNANTFVLHAGELEDKADKLGLGNDFKANLANPLKVAEMRAKRDPRIVAYDNTVQPVLREFTNIMVGSHITDKEVETYKNALYAAQTPQERHAALATMTQLMRDRLDGTVAQRHANIMGVAADPNQFLFEKQRGVVTRLEGLAAKDEEDRAKAAAQPGGGGGGGRPGTTAAAPTGGKTLQRDPKDGVWKMM